MCIIMNQTYQNIVDALHCTNRTWEKVKDDLKNVTLINSLKGTYGLCYKSSFLGAFIKAEYVDLKELKDTPFTYIKNKTLGK